jgi:YD repeat-containing protein
VARPARARAACATGAAILFLWLSPPTLGQQVTYEYDALGRLILMTSPEGIAQWEYDAVGNILRITSRRYADVSGPVAILGMNPTKGGPGTTVTLYGRGFGAAPTENQVAFNGTNATVSTATTGTLTVIVPSAATTGPISVTAPLGSATSPEPFTVQQALAVVPGQADVALRGTVDFESTLAGVPTVAVTWRVNGVVGGSAQMGTISPDGSYTAPATPPPVQPVLVEAVLTGDPTQVATATVRVVGQASGMEAAAPVSVGAQPNPGPTASGAVSVGWIGQSAPAASAPVTVGGTPHSGPVTAGPVTVAAGPVLHSVAPATVAAGASAVPLTVMGRNLHNASSVRFLRNGSPDGTIAAASLTPAGDGTRLDCLVTVGAGAAHGSRVVQVVTPQGTSSSFDLGANAMTITP